MNAQTRAGARHSAPAGCTGEPPASGDAERGFHLIGDLLHLRPVDYLYIVLTDAVDAVRTCRQQRLIHHLFHLFDPHAQAGEAAIDVLYIGFATQSADDHAGAFIRCHLLRFGFVFRFAPRRLHLHAGNDKAKA